MSLNHLERSRDASTTHTASSIEVACEDERVAESILSRYFSRWEGGAGLPTGG